MVRQLLKRFAGLFMLTFAVSVLTTTAQARPWIEPSDQRARHSVQYLADNGCLSAPVTTWPVMWADISPALDRARGQCRDNEAARYLRFERNRTQNRDLHAEIGVSAANEELLFRDAAGGPRERGEINLRADWLTTNVAMGLSVHYAHDPRDDNELRFDGSYIAGMAGNWVIGVGANDRWWGPGQHSSLILSNNARPIPALWINRANSEAPQVTGLQWLGPWNLTVFNGVLESGREVPEAMLFGARFAFKPHPALELGLNRSFKWGGRKQSRSFDVFRRCATGNVPDSVGVVADPCDLRVGADMRLTLPLGPESVSLYAQIMGEDEANLTPSNNLHLFGVETTSSLWQGQQRYYIEFVSNTVRGVFGDDDAPNQAYENDVYATGHRFQGRAIASTWESDSRATSLGLSHYFFSGAQVAAIISRVELNRDGTSPPRGERTDNLLLDAVDDQTVNVLTLRYQRPMLGGQVTLLTQQLSERIRASQDEYSRQNVGVAYQYRF